MTLQLLHDILYLVTQSNKVEDKMLQHSTKDESHVKSELKQPLLLTCLHLLQVNLYRWLGCKINMPPTLVSKLHILLQDIAASDVHQARPVIQEAAARALTVRVTIVFLLPSKLHIVIDWILHFLSHENRAT